jgi:hypothetical protein
MRGDGSLLRPWPREASERETGLRHRALWWAALERGLLLNQTGLLALSTPMDREVVEEAAVELGGAIEDVANGWRPPDGAGGDPPPAEA